MSFLIRRQKQTGGRGFGGPSNSQGSLTASFAAKARATVRPARGGQGQVLMHRQRPNGNKTTSVQHQAGQKQVATQQEQAQNVVSMAEVMADLRVLEDQQKESQKQLENVRQTKENRLQQRLSLEKSLEKCKYSNGEQRVQLGRARELLSTTNRLIGSKRLQEDRSSEDLRAFSKLMKNGLLGTRINNEYRRKIEATLLVSIGKANARSKRLEEILEKPKRVERARDEAKSKLDSLRKQVHAEVANARGHSEQVAATRSDLSTLEHELSKAQQMETSTKMHAESLENELLNERKRDSEELDAMRQEIEAKKQAKKDRESMAVEAQASIDKVKTQMRDLQARMTSIQTAEDLGSNETPDSSSGGNLDAESFDLSSISSALTKEQERLKALSDEKQQLLATIETAKESESKLAEREEILQDKITEITKASGGLRSAETERRKAMDEQVAELEAASNELSRLHQSFSELNETRVNHRNAAGEQAKALEEKLKTKRQELSSLVSELNDKTSSIKTFEENISRTTQENEAKIRELNQLYDDAQKSLDDAKAFLATSDAAEEEYKAVENDKCEETEETKKVDEAISTLLHEYQELKSLEFSYDPIMSTDGQAETVLQNLVRSCEKRVDAAKKEKKAARSERRKAKRQQRKEEAKRRRKEQAERGRKESEARRLREEAERKHKEETERKIQEAAAERQRQEEEEERRAREEEERKRKEERKRREEGERKAKEEKVELMRKETEQRESREQEKRELKEEEKRKMQEATDERKRRETEERKVREQEKREEARQRKSWEKHDQDLVDKGGERLAEKERKPESGSKHKSNRGHGFGKDRYIREEERPVKVVDKDTVRGPDDEKLTDDDNSISAPAPTTTPETSFKTHEYSQPVESSQKRVRWQDDTDDESIDSPLNFGNSNKIRGNTSQRQFGTKGRENLGTSSSKHRTTKPPSRSFSLGRNSNSSKTSGLASSRKKRRNSEGSDGGILAQETISPKGPSASGRRPEKGLQGVNKQRLSSKNSRNSRSDSLTLPKSRKPAASVSAGSTKEKQRVSRSSSGGIKTSRSSKDPSRGTGGSKRNIPDVSTKSSSSKRVKSQHESTATATSKKRSSKKTTTFDASKSKRRKPRKNDIMGVKKTAKTASFGEDYEFNF